MQPNESTPTPAQRELLDFLSRSDASARYLNLNNTLALAMCGHQSGPGDPFVPSAATLEDWYFVLCLLQIIHRIATEEPPAPPVA